MTVLITGANRGIGRALLDQYQHAGTPVVGTMRGNLPETGDWVPLDVAKPASISTLPDALAGRSLDLLVCNAGVYLDKGERLDSGYPPDQWAECFAVNVTGVFLTIQTLLPLLEDGNPGKIAIISSQMASTEHAPGGSLIYRASKAAVLNLGRNLSRDLAARGIPVGIYHPGWVKTDMGGSAADISEDEAAVGLIRRFEALSPQSTGCFETWDGRAHAY